MPRGRTDDLPLGAGRVVVHTGNLVLRRHATLRLVGSPATTEAIVRVGGSLFLERGAAIVLAGGLPAERVLFVVGGGVTARRGARIAGTVLGAGNVYLGWSTSTQGAVLGSGDIEVSNAATVELRPFAGW